MQGRGLMTKSGDRHSKDVRTGKEAMKGQPEKCK